MSEVRPGEVLTWQGVVAPADCDHLGHMNVQHYFAAAGDGMFAFGHEYGLSTGEVTRRRMCFVVVHSEADFRRELRAGDTIALYSRIVEVAEKTVSFGHRLMRLEDQAVSFEMVMRAALLDLDTRRARDIPEDIRAALVVLETAARD